MKKTIVLGAGMTGLAAGYASGLPVYEASERPGGICSSYYMRPGSSERLAGAPADGEAYRFEIGGGHWIFGGDPAVLEFIREVAGVETYTRKFSVFFPDTDLYVPYPLQNHLHCLDPKLASRALSEMLQHKGSPDTMKEWLCQSFGPTLCALFFDRFHQLYTSGLYDQIRPQDSYKSPVAMALVVRGAFGDVDPVGYNVQFVCPSSGLDVLASRLAQRCDVRYGKRAVRIDPGSRVVTFEDGDGVAYDRLVCTLPLNKIMEMTGLEADGPADPHSSVHVVNVGATRGPRCPDDHWLYFSDSASGFHRVGFYSAVDARFLPASARASRDRVSIYVERSCLARPPQQDEAIYAQAVVRELRDLGYIDEVEVLDCSWIEVAYTWSWPRSGWTTSALRRLQERGIFQVGRYGRWVFQGIADSIRDGFIVGSAFKGG